MPSPKSDQKPSLIEDERLSTSSLDQDAGRRSMSSADASRVDEDGTIASRSERRISFRDEFMEFALPTPPKNDQWHYFWWSTTSQHDPLQRRIRLGYEVVTPEMLPGFGDFRVKNGQHEGAIGVNEMILLRVPREHYLAYMNEVHHTAPLEEEGRLDVQWQLTKEAGGKIRDQALVKNEDGMSDTQRAVTVKSPVFE